MTGLGWVGPAPGQIFPKSERGDGWNPWNFFIAWFRTGLDALLIFPSLFSYLVFPFCTLLSLLTAVQKLWFTYPAYYTRPTHQPTHHTLCLFAARTSACTCARPRQSAYTRLDYGSLPAATHRPTWPRSSTSPTMMCVYRVLPNPVPNPNTTITTNTNEALAPSPTSMCTSTGTHPHNHNPPPKMRISDF